jgi:Flp pilus assembly protein TadG
VIGPQRAASRLGRVAAGSEGQAIFEFAILIPLFLLVLVAIFEFGFVFNHNLTLEYATREGARTGAALGNGDGDPTVCASIDAQIVAAAQRVLTAPGSAVDLSRVSSISIWRATSTGATDTSVGVFTWTNTGPGTGPTVDGARLGFSPPSPLPGTWRPCSRVATGTTPDSIGVSLTYSYAMQTPLAAMLSFVGGRGAATLAMTDRTVMALNPN